jgi:carbamoyl-phosphate synthase large subunit
MFSSSRERREVSQFRNSALAARLLVLQAGSAPGNNLIRSLKAGDPPFVIVGCNDSRFFLKKSTAQRNYALPISSRNWPRALRRIIERERIDLVLPATDSDVLSLSRARHTLGCRTFLPRQSVIERCLDKLELATFLRRRGIAAPLTYPIRSIEEVPRLFRKFKRSSRLWCRMRAGSGSYAAIPVDTRQQVQSWILYWERMRGVSPGSFTLSEYLPGRDFCVQCLWDKGRLVLVKMAERITYLDTGSPSGVSSMPALAVTAFDAELLDVCTQAIRALDSHASGVFFVDLKEDEEGRPCITEINAGRFATMTNIHDLVGKHNMAQLYVRLGLGQRVNIQDTTDYAEGFYLVRSVDTLPTIVRGDELFRGIRDLGA